MDEFLASRPDKSPLARATDLLARGELVDLGEDEDGRLFVWVAPLTPAEHEEAILDSAVAQAREVVLSGRGSVKYDAVAEEMRSNPREGVIEQLLKTRMLEAWAFGEDDLRLDDYWNDERLLLIERADASIEAGLPLDPDQTNALGVLNDRYLDDWNEKARARLKAFQREYEERTTEDLVEEFMKAWSQSHCARAQNDEYRVTQLFYGTRVCRAVQTPVGGLDHSHCNGHLDQIFPSRESVRRSPEELTVPLGQAAERLERKGAGALGK